MSAANRRFALHYLEMLVVMLLGMELLSLPVDALVHVHGTGPMLLEMGATMTVPMIAWMRVRGHAWQPCLEMGASMVLPTLGTLVLLGVGVEGVGVLMLIMHAVMLPAMLIAMLLRRDEYSCHHGSHRHVMA